MTVGVKIELDGLSKLFGKLTRASRRDVLEKTLRDVALHLVRWVKTERLSGPRPEFLGVKSGRLRSSISKSPVKESGGLFGAKEYTVRIGTNVEYARKHEFGEGIRKRPFLQPALEDQDNQKFAINELTRRINIALNLESLGL